MLTIFKNVDLKLVKINIKYPCIYATYTGEPVRSAQDCKKCNSPTWVICENKPFQKININCCKNCEHRSWRSKNNHHKGQ